MLEIVKIIGLIVSSVRMMASTTGHVCSWNNNVFVVEIWIIVHLEYCNDAQALFVCLCQNIN